MNVNENKTNTSDEKKTNRVKPKSSSIDESTTTPLPPADVIKSELGNLQKAICNISDVTPTELPTPPQLKGNPYKIAKSD